MLCPIRGSRVLRAASSAALLAFACLSCTRSSFDVSDETKTGTASVKTEKLSKQGKPAKPCVPRLASSARQEPPKRFRFRKGETYRRSPIVSYQVDVDGRISDAKLVRSSGVRDIDSYALQTIKNLRYKPAPGCEPLQVEADINIHFEE